MKLRWKILLGAVGVVTVLIMVAIGARWLGRRNQLYRTTTSPSLGELELLLGNDTSASNPAALLQASERNQIEEKGKRQGQYLYFGSGKVFYRWGSVNLGQVGATQAQFICIKDDQVTPEGEKVKVSQSWLDITRLYQDLVNGYRYPKETLLTPDQIASGVKKLSPITVLLKDNIPMLVIFFGCNL